MQTIIEAAQPYITSIVLALIGLLTSVILAGINKLKAKADALLDSKLSESQRALLHTITAEAYAYAEAEYYGQGGPAKLAAATQYALDKLGKLGVTITLKEVQSAIHAAWIDVGGDQKPSSVSSITIDGTEYTVESGK